MLVDVRAAAERLGISVSQCYVLVSKKRISYYRDGNGPIKFAERHLEEYLESIEHGRGETWPVRKTPSHLVR